MERYIIEHGEKLYRLCLYLEKNPYNAEELFQDGWIKILEKAYTYDSKYAFYPWASQIIVNLYRDRLRKIRREMQHLLWKEPPDMPDKKVDLERKVINEERANEIQESLRALGDKYRIPLILAYSDGLSYKEIAKVLGIKESTVKSRIYDGKQKLKKRLIKEGIS